MRYLNYAALCPTRPEAAHAVEATMQAFDTMLYSPAGLQWYEQTLAACRRSIARFLHVPDPSAIAFVPNASLAAHLLVSLLDWRAGDLVLTSTHENPSVMRAINRLVHRGVQIALVDPASPSQLLDTIERCVTTRPVKAILLSHVSHVDGRILPIAEVGALAHGREIAFFIDGAQAVGHIPVHLDRQAFDVYFFPGHKWCRGPLGTGALALHPQFLAHHPAMAAGIRTQTPASRFEIGTHHIGLIAGLAAACEVIQRNGLEAMASTPHRRTVVTVLGAVPAIAFPDWAGPFAPGIVTCSYRKRRGQAPLGRDLYARDAVVVKDFTEYPAPLCPAIRISWLPDTSPDDIAALLDGVKAYAEPS